jgi:hypothetical protein
MKELLGGCLQAVGILITGLFGLCSLIAIANIYSWRSFSAAITNLVFLGVPLFAGIGLIYAGRALIRSARDDDGRNF